MAENRFETAKRHVKAAKLSALLMDRCWNDAAAAAAMAANMTPATWRLASAEAGVHPPSQTTVDLIVDALALMANRSWASGAEVIRGLG